jgi:hypothetical protein
LTGATGLIAMLAWLIAYPIGLGLPGVDAPSDQITLFAWNHPSVLDAFAVLIAIGATLVVVFLVGLHQVLRDEQPSNVFASIGLVGGVVAQTLVMVGVVFAAAEGFLPWLSPDGIARSTVLLFLCFAISAWPTILATTAFGLALMQSTHLPRIAAWLAFATAAVHLGGGLSLAWSGPFSPSGPIAESAPALFMLWVFVVSVGLLVTRVTVRELDSPLASTAREVLP